MAAKPRLRIGSSALALIATATFMSATAAPALASTGGVYFDANDNAAAGNPAHLFNGSFTGAGNVGVGETVMPNLASGEYNVAVGLNALEADTAGGSNVATGVGALGSNIAGNFNVAAGPGALQANTAGNDNVATGHVALFSNATGHDNVATGSFALLSSDSGDDNVATGSRALFSNTTGSANVATGARALIENTTGDRNIAIGDQAGSNLTVGSDNIEIGNQAKKPGESKVIRIGTKSAQRKAFLAGVSGTTVSGTAQPVVVNAQGQLGTATAASAKASAAKPLGAAAGRRLLATVKRLQEQNRRQGREIRELRAQR
jgi:hypothetical protein